MRVEMSLCRVCHFPAFRGSGVKKCADDRSVQIYP
jgi:hypothetical protein